MNNTTTPKKSFAFKLTAAIFLIAIIAGPIVYHYLTKPEDIEQSMAFAEMKQLWLDFRTQNPYNIQMVGIKKYEDNSYVMILSEPCEYVEEAVLQDFFKKYNSCFKTYYRVMGYDGWLKDVVVCFNNIKETKIPQMTTNLFNILYDTDYKAYLVDLNDMPQHVAFSEQNLNYQISEEELRSWFVSGEEKLIKDNNTEEVSLTKALTKPMTTESEIYYSKTPGFVVWIIKRSNDLDSQSFRKMARIFSVDSDLILGAIANSYRVAIIARERTIPIMELPPMRPDMLQILSSTKKEELSQSYERSSLFAGKLKGGKDYAPILLSDELWHTEYGNMLNITDQMLKSWSENGQIEYVAFNYPKPIDWAFKEGVMVDLGVNELTYNWNTSGAGYVLDGDDGLSVYFVNRTGSLPISYIPGDLGNEKETDPVYQAEEIAYDFYSNLSSPELVKVVQYASMYQIFQNFGVHVHDAKTNFSNSITSRRLDGKAGEVLSSICDLKYRKINNNQPCTHEIEVNIAKNKVAKIREYFEEDYDRDEMREYLGKQFDINNKEFKNVWYSFFITSYEFSKKCFIDDYMKKIDDENDKIIEDYLCKLDTVIDYIYYKKDEFVDGTPCLDVIGHYLMNPQDINVDQHKIYLTDNDRCQIIAYNISFFNREIREYNKILKVVSLDEAKETYLKENGSKSLRWQKCPTIVESWSIRDSIVGEGGHNLNSHVTKGKINNTLKAGEYKVVIDPKTGRKIIEYSAFDKGRVTSSFLRNIEKTDVNGLRQFKKGTEVVRPRREVLSSVEKRTARGFNETDHLKIARQDNGFVINDKKVSSFDGMMEEFRSCVENGKEAPFKTIELKNISENEQIALIDGLKEVKISRSRELSKIPNKSFDVSKIAIENIGDDVVVIKVPINAETVRISAKAQQTMSLSPQKSLWGKIKTAWYEFKVPGGKAEQFKTVLKNFLKDPKGSWNRFLFKRQLKLNGIENVEFKEVYELDGAVNMGIKVAQKNKKVTDKVNANIFKEKAA